MYIHAYISITTDVYILVHIYVYRHIYVYIYIYIYIYILLLKTHWEPALLRPPPPERAPPWPTWKPGQRFEDLDKAMRCQNDYVRGGLMSDMRLQSKGSTYTYMCVYIYTHTLDCYLGVNVYIYIYIYIYKHTYISTCTYMYI